MNPAKLEVCVDSIESLRLAVQGGADRIELCADLDVGGLTPTADILIAAQYYDLPIRAMIRPRGGDFQYSLDEISQMEAEIEAVRRSGIEGVVLGAATSDNRLDDRSLRKLLEKANPMPATLHRVIDTLTDPLTAIDQAIDLGFDTVLTSGSQDSAAQGCDMIAEMVARAAGRIDIMPGAGISPANASEILQKTGAPWLHGSFSTPLNPNDLRGAPNRSMVTSETQCRQMAAICHRKPV